jgi:hypothetical protein
VTGLAEDDLAEELAEHPVDHPLPRDRPVTS